MKLKKINKEQETIMNMAKHTSTQFGTGPTCYTRRPGKIASSLRLSGMLSGPRHTNTKGISFQKAGVMIENHTYWIPSSPTFLALRTSEVVVEGMVPHNWQGSTGVQLYLCEWTAGAPAANANGVCTHTLACCLHKWGCTLMHHFRSPGLTTQGLAVGHNPRIGTPAIDVIV